MSQIKVRDFLMHDFETLYVEYQNEIGNENGQRKYEQLFNNYIKSNTEKFIFTSEIGVFMGIYIQIVVDTYHTIETSFYSPNDLERYGIELRKTPDFRDFSKLCFYIEDKVEPH